MEMVIIEYAGTEWNAWEFDGGYYIPDINIWVPQMLAA